MSRCFFGMLATAVYSVQRYLSPDDRSIIRTYYQNQIDENVRFWRGLERGREYAGGFLVLCVRPGVEVVLRFDYILLDEFYVKCVSKISSNSLAGPTYGSSANHHPPYYGNQP
jgi:hypothetical protein